MPDICLEFLLNEAHCQIFINADLIAAGIRPFMPEWVSIKAGSIMLSEITGRFIKDSSFTFETTLSGMGYLASFRNGVPRDITSNSFFTVT